MIDSPGTPEPDASDRLAQLGARLARLPYARRGVPIGDRIIRVLLVDDHTLVREVLRLLLGSAPDIAVVGEAADGGAGLDLAQRTSPDVVVLDLDMPGLDGASTMHELRRTVPSARVLILTVHPERERLLPLLDAGARGYLTKDSAARDLVDAVRVVSVGEVYVRPDIARQLASAVAGEPASAAPREGLHVLSDRERTIFRLIAEGYSGMEIARQLGVSGKTVDAYKRRIEGKLSLSHRTDYVRFALATGVLARGA